MSLFLHQILIQHEFPDNIKKIDDLLVQIHKSLDKIDTIKKNPDSTMAELKEEEKELRSLTIQVNLKNKGLSNVFDAIVARSLQKILGLNGPEIKKKLNHPALGPNFASSQ